LAWLKFVAEILAILFFEFSDDEISLLFGFVLAGVGLISVETLVFIEFFLLGAVELGREVEFDFFVGYWKSGESGEELELLGLVFHGFGLLSCDYLETCVIKFEILSLFRYMERFFCVIGKSKVTELTLVDS
jgi:hypothetical protein